MAGFEDRRVYVTDDCDIDDNQLEMFMGGNGDWYVVIRYLGPQGAYRTRAVRITTSGQRLTGMVEACANLYRALETRT